MPSAITLTTAQQHAMDAIAAFAQGAHGAAMMTLAGYAGTGKTTVVSALVEALAGKLRIAIAAPTNKAVGVLREKIVVPVNAGSTLAFGSIHSFLGLRLREQDDGQHACSSDGVSTLHEYDLVIVDEASMLGHALFARIATKIQHNSTRVLFVGDPAQLPPVEDGGAESPAFSCVQHRVQLLDIVRQAADSPIIRISLRVRQAIEQGVKMSTSELAAALPPPPANALLAGGGTATAFNWALHDIQQGHDTRILAFRNDTVIRYNREIHAAMHGTATPFAPGEIVMLNASHEAREANTQSDTDRPLSARKTVLFNSEECTVHDLQCLPHPRHEHIPAWRVVLAQEDGSLVQLWVADQPSALNAEVSRLFDQVRRIKAQLMITPDRLLDSERKVCVAKAWSLKNDFADLRHVYAMTVHKSQGSTLHTAILDWADLCRMANPFEFNRALYVAVTRAAHHLAVVTP